MPMKDYRLTNQATNRSVSLSKDWGACLEEAVERYGRALVFALYQEAAGVQFRKAVQEALKDPNNTLDDVRVLGNSFHPDMPGTRKRKTSTKDLNTIADRIVQGELSFEELKDIIARKRQEQNHHG